MLQQKRSMMLSFDCRKGLAQKKKETLIIAQQEYPDEFQQQHSKKKRIKKNSNCLQVMVSEIRSSACQHSPACPLAGI